MLQNPLTLLLYSLISIGCRSVARFNTKQLSPASTLSLVQLLHTSPSCFISILLLVLFIQPKIFHEQRVCRRTLGDRSFQYMGPIISNSSFLCQACHVTHLFQVKTENPPLLPTDLSLSFFCFHQTHDYYTCVFVGVCVCVCMCVSVCVHVCGMCVF